MSAVSGLLKRMEASGLVRREVAPQNRRQTLVYLTAEGEQLHSQMHTAMVVADKQLSKAIPKEDKVALMKVVDQIRVLIGEEG